MRISSDLILMFLLKDLVHSIFEGELHTVKPLGLSNILDANSRVIL